MFTVQAWRYILLGWAWFSWGGRGVLRRHRGVNKSVFSSVLLRFITFFIFKILKTVLIMDPRCLAYHTALHAPIESKHTTPPDLEERGTRVPLRIICLSA